MTNDEATAHQEIIQTLNRFNSYADRGMSQSRNSFADDIVFEFQGANPGENLRLEGKEDFGKFVKGLRDGSIKHSEAGMPPEYFRHHLTTCHIELTGPDTADVRTYFTVFTAIGPDHCGVYNDKWRKTDGRWLIAERRPRTEWRSSESLFGFAPLPGPVKGG